MGRLSSRPETVFLFISGSMRWCRRTTRFARSLRFSILLGPFWSLRPITLRSAVPSIDPVLMIRMLIVAYVFGIRPGAGAGGRE